MSTEHDFQSLHALHFAVGWNQTRQRYEIRAGDRFIHITEAEMRDAEQLTQRIDEAFIDSVSTETSDAATKRPKLHIYQATDGWRWRLKARNGRIVADSAEAYSSRTKARNAADALYSHVRNATITEDVA